MAAIQRQDWVGSINGVPECQIRDREPIRLQHPGVEDWQIPDDAIYVDAPPFHNSYEGCASGFRGKWRGEVMKKKGRCGGGVGEVW